MPTLKLVDDTAPIAHLQLLIHASQLLSKIRLQTTLPNTTMEIMDLPPEILNKILVQAVIARGLPRALRLQLVCSKQ